MGSLRVIRTAWFYLVLVISTIWFSLRAVVAGLLGVRSRTHYDGIARGWSRSLLSAAGTPVVIEGAEGVPRDRSVVYASNHSSLFDIPALFAYLPGSVRFVAKQELARIPLFGQAMIAAGNVVIDRANVRHAAAAYERAAQTMRGGISAIVFPEGTRSRTGELLPFKAMPFMLAIAAQAPLVPVYVHNTFEIYPKSAWRLRPRPIRIWVGPPIETTGMRVDDRDQLRRRALEFIAGTRARVDAASRSG